VIIVNVQYDRNKCEERKRACVRLGCGGGKQDDEEKELIPKGKNTQPHVPGHVRRMSRSRIQITAEYIFFAFYQ
jgi:hypothetical protein